MQDQIKQTIFHQFNPEEKKGVFFTGYDAAKEVVFSEGVVHTQDPLRQTIDSIYTNYIAKRLDEVRYIAVDIVSEIIELSSQEMVRQMSPKEFGFIIVDVEDEKTGVMLPNMSGVPDVKTVLYTIKQKYGIHGKVEIYVFRTERFIVAK